MLPGVLVGSIFSVLMMAFGLVVFLLGLLGIFSALVV